MITCVVDELSFLPECCSYSTKEKEHEGRRDSGDIYQGRVTNPVDNITSSADLEELLMSCRSSRVGVENVMARFTKHPKKTV